MVYAGPNKPVKLRDLFAGKKVRGCQGGLHRCNAHLAELATVIFTDHMPQGVIFAVPGAYTPGCSKTHLPGQCFLSQSLWIAFTYACAHWAALAAGPAAPQLLEAI